MDDVKEIVYDKLSEISTITVGSEEKDVTVRYSRPEEIVDEDLVMVTYSISDNNLEYDLGKEIVRQNVQVVVDLWCRDSLESQVLLNEVETKMREINYLLGFSSDIPDPKGYSHITARFNF